MGKLPIKNGTPVGSASLCRTCSYAQIVTGFKESELITICDYPQPSFVVPFNVYKCSRYYDKNRPTWDQMEKLAIEVKPAPTLKPVGFKTGTGFTQTTSIRVGSDNTDEDDD